MKLFSIVIITHNNAEIIEATLEKMIRDIVDLPCYLIMYDDCSEDNTPAVLDKYSNKYPTKIAYIPGEVPIGMERATMLISNIVETDYYCVLRPGEWDKGYIHELEIGQDLLDKDSGLRIWTSSTNTNLMLFRKNQSKPTLPFLVVCVGQACNLKCKNCSNFAPLSPKEFYRYDVNDIIADLACILNIFKIKDLQIQGGEPMIYPDLDKLLIYLGNCENVDSITIATNGIHVPSDRILDLIARFNITVRISNYVELGNRVDGLRNKIKERGISMKEWHFASGKDVWNYLGGTEVTREDNDNVVANRFRSCRFRICSTLENGEIVHCSRAVNAVRIQGFKPEKKDSVMVRGNENLGIDLADYINKMNYMEACRYCYGTDSGQYCTPAEQI